MVEASEGLRHARPRGPRSGWVPLGISTAVVVVLLGGWALVNTVLPSGTPVAAGQSMTIASAEGHEAKLTFGRGWEIFPGDSSAGENYRLGHGSTQLRLNVALPERRASDIELWEGMRNIVRVGDPSASLTDPQPVTTASGAEGLTGVMHSNRNTGTATLFPSPNKGFVIEATATGAGQGEAERLLQTLRFDRVGGGA